ncbi:MULTISPECIES: peptidase domain-containing ABC transporter [unclassified Sphingomonas]|uniref:peptidase domain-containing ABC transporter n=1 Tax=unclassified Sphingomonas TaxID=196159 RepID=UPI002861F387|nr:MULTISPECIES: peptidase domain-containing ABC transporter [unclassified Sphingomonas]MDR6115063.1 ATP-binding cassette subfamily B protein RaxB [Sphingomonas sp. SORGH_AS_0789]MDR6151263.1 ATP-binding cassette subfamily B protein RaxB [Sphingomonas sp. SORGH_AS_0742]
MLVSPDGQIIKRNHSKISLILQSEAAECGLACLAMIAGAYGHEVSLAELRRRYSISSKGMNLRGILNVAAAMELTGRPLRVEVSKLASLKGPVILHWNFNHFVVLANQRRGKMLIYDPATGSRWVDSAEFGSSFTGIAIEFTPSSNFERRKKPEVVRLSDLASRMRGFTSSIVQMFFLAALMQLFALATPLLSQLVVDEAITKGDADLLGVLAIGMILLLITTNVIKLTQGFIGLYIFTQIAFQAKTNLLRHAMRLPVSWFEKRHIGDVISRFSSLSPIQSFALNTIPSAMLDILIAIVSLAMMTIYSFELAALELSCVAIYLLVRLGTFGHVKRLTTQGIHISSNVETIFLETIRGAKTLKLFGKENERITIWQNEQAKLINNSAALSKFGLWGGSGVSLLIGFQQIIIWFIGAKFVIEGKLTLGMLFAFQAYGAQFGSSANSIVAHFFSFRTLEIHLERLADVIHTEEEPGLDVQLMADVRSPAVITLHDVSFRYADHEPDVIKGVSLDIHKGDFICLKGPSGHGKSTIVKLLLGFEHPHSGEIKVDGIPLRQYGVSRYRSMVGAVLQDDQLFSGTLSENISFFDISGSDDRIQQAAKDACIHDEIMKFPMGYQTFTGDLGTNLSAGQRQRILLARALYREPEILFLDEGTANLDPVSETAVMDVVRSLPITRVVVAHREGATLGASRTIWVENGAIVEQA